MGEELIIAQNVKTMLIKSKSNRNLSKTML